MANCLKTALVANILSGCALPINGVAELYLISRDDITSYTISPDGGSLAAITIAGTGAKVAKVDGFGNSVKVSEAIKTTDYVTGLAQTVTIPSDGYVNYGALQSLLSGNFVAFTRSENLQYRVYGLFNGLEATGYESNSDTNGNRSTVTLSTPENAGIEIPILVVSTVWATLKARLFTK